MSYFMQADLNVLCADTTEHHGLIIFITFTVVSISGESRTTRAAERSLGICTSGIVPTAVVGILSTLINVCNEIYSMICATMIVGGRMKKYTFI